MYMEDIIMEKAKNFDELMHDESFLNKLNEAKSPEEAEEMCAAQGFDLNSELSGLPEGELSDEQLDSVAGGGLSWGAVKTAWDVGTQAGVIIRNLWDMKKGRPLSYPNWRFEW